jgi:hypothetical protein
VRGKFRRAVPDHVDPNVAGRLHVPHRHLGGTVGLLVADRL